MNWYYRNHDSSGNMKRLWREDWSGDQFDILDKMQFAQRTAHLCNQGDFVLEADED